MQTESLLNPLNILIVEDSEDDLLLVLRSLKQGGLNVASERVETAVAMTDALNRQAWDVIICDYNLPNFGAPAALALLKTTGLDIPFIVVSGFIGEEAAVEMMKNGAHDFIKKDNLSRLVPAINRELKDAGGRKARRIAEEALKKAKEFNETVINCIGNDISIIDPYTYQIVAANKAFLEKSGFVRMEEIIGKPCYEITHHGSGPCSPPDHPCPLVELLKNSSTSVVREHVHRTENGETIYAEVSVSAIRDEKGALVHVVHIARDITENKMAAMEKSKLEAMLMQAQKMEAVGTLAGGIAHDFNNILTAIMGYANLLQMKLEKESCLMAYIESILSSSKRAAKLVQSLLTFSRKQVLNFHPVNVNEIVTSLGKMLPRLIREDIEFRTVLTNADLTIMADSGQLDQVIMNLCTNAKDAMPQGGALIIQTDAVELDDEFVRAQGHGKPGVYALLSVSDTGFGIDEETRKKIFEPFFTTKEFGKGTGLGLAMVYGIVNQHNGFINCYSEPGKGTTFKIMLPLADAENKRKEKEQTVCRFPQGGAETLLLAEDDTDVRMIVKTVCEHAGYKVLAAVDGEDAVSKFRDNKDTIQLVLLDLIMPRKNGKEAYEEIKKLSPDIKTLFMSGYTADIVHEQDIGVSGVELISKPVMPGELLRKVRELLDR